MKPSGFLIAALLAAGFGFSDDFETLHSELFPEEPETWETIPWRTSLLGAQAVAAAEGKPIFIWAMDGHPLGCT